MWGITAILIIIFRKIGDLEDAFFPEVLLGDAIASKKESLKEFFK